MKITISKNSLNSANSLSSPMTQEEHNKKIKICNSEIPSFNVNFNEESIKNLSSRLFNHFTKPLTNDEYQIKFNK